MQRSHVLHHPAQRWSGPVEPAPQADIARQVIDGLSQPRKRLPSALFYDDAGTLLFQQIMALPES